MADNINIVGFKDSSEPNGGYAYDGIRQDLAPIETESQDLVRKLIDLVHSEALDGSPVAIAGAHTYERKGYISADTLGGHRNPSYGSRTDDVLLQLTVRVNYDRAREIVAAVGEERSAREEAKAAAKRAEIDEQIARLQAQREAL